MENKPKVNFADQTVLGVFAGQKGSGGYSINVVRVEQTNNGVLVKVVETQPGKNCIVTDVISSPYQIVAVPKLKGEVKFDKQTVVYDCEQTKN